MVALDQVNGASRLLVRALASSSSQLGTRGFIDKTYAIEHFADNLPDYDVGELRQWLRLYFHKPTSMWYFIQAIAASVFLGLILFFGAIVIVYRLFDRTLWLFRIQDSRGSPLIIPNSITSFVLFEAMCAVVLIADVWNNLAIDKWGADPSLTGFWNGTPWILLFTGAWCGAWGTFFASPGILHRSTRLKGFDARRLLPGPKMCNFIGIAAPVAFTATCMAVTIPTGLTYKSAVEQWQDWDAKAALLPQGSYPVQGDLRAEAAAVWKQIADAWWWSSVGWLALLCFAWAFLIFYLFCGGFLVYTIRSQLQLMRKRSGRSDGAQQGADEPGAAFDAAALEAPRWDQKRAAELEADMEMSRAQASTFFPPLATQGTATTGPSTRKSRIKMLRSAMINVTFIYSSISCGTLGFVVNLHWLLAQQYQRSSAGPIENNATYEKYMTVVVWIASVFGVMCFAAISQKTFEGVFEEWSANREAKQQAKESRQTESSATLTTRRDNKNSSSVSLRLKNLKTTLTPTAPIISCPASRAASAMAVGPSADDGMDPAHTQALQYFQRQREHGLGLLQATSAVDLAKGHEDLSYDVNSANPAQAGRALLAIIPSHGEPTLKRTSVLPFDQYRHSPDPSDRSTSPRPDAGQAPRGSPRTPVVPSGSDALTPGGFASSVRGIKIQRDVTSTTEDLRAYPQGLDGLGSAMVSGSRSRSILKEGSSPIVWRSAFDAFGSPTTLAVPAQAHRGDSQAGSAGSSTTKTTRSPT